MDDTLKRVERGDFFLIAGPCVIESEGLCFEIANHVKAIAAEFDIPFIFKASFKKANRLSADSFSGPGLTDGLAVLAAVKHQLNLPILTDVHEVAEVEPAARVADVLQIPAFLCRQTDLVAAAGACGKWLNIKKGQFLAPEDMSRLVEKASSKKVMVTERGSSFGYRQLVVDFRSLLIMKEEGRPVIFDATHSLQLPGGGGSVSTGQPQYTIPMARAATAIGIDGLFVETHPEPAKALSDAGAMLPLNRMKELLKAVTTIRKACL